MVEVICDTNFLIHLATKRIRNIDNIEMDIGTLVFLIPKVVINELLNLHTKKNSNNQIDITLEFIKKFNTIEIEGNFADKEIIEYVKQNPCFVGTMDVELKKMIKKFNGKIISFNKDNLVLEN